MKKFKEFFLSPFFAAAFILVGMLIYYALSYLFSLKFGFFDIEETGITESLTYLFYGLGLGVGLCYMKDYINTEKQNTYFAIIFLFFAAILREMGIQHWLTTHDTVITKTRFFLNPDNPLYEKLIAGFLMLLVAGVLFWVIFKNLKNIVKGFFKLQTIPWTFAVFTFWACLTQIADRLPANYLKATGAELAQHAAFVLKIFEEGGESLLPLIFAIAILQYHLILKNNSKTNA